MTSDPNGLDSAVRNLSRLLLAEEPLGATLGRVAVLAVPLAAGDRPVGALNLYSLTAESFDEDDEETAVLFSQQAAVACANAEVYWRTHSLTEHLREALESRDIIGQAKGILMARR